MRRTLIIGTAALAIGLLYSSLALAGDGNGGSSAVARQCTQQQNADRAAFKAVYGDHAMRTCIRGPLDASGSEFKNAAKECKGEREADAAAFQETYGSIHSKGHNALGKCVSSKVKEDDAGDSV